MDQKDNIARLLNAVSIQDVVSEVTETRPEIASVVEHVRSVVNEDDFTEAQPKEPQQPVEEYESYDAQANAEGLVYGLTSIDAIVLSAVVTLKGRKSAGGSKMIKKMREARIKEMSGATLTETDLKMIAGFKAFKADMDLLSDGMQYSQPKLDHLVKMAIPWCEETKFESSKSFAFWGNYVSGLVEKVTQILIS